jgi:hypothetical protein
VGNKSNVISVKIIGDAKGLESTMATVETTVAAPLQKVGKHAEEAGGKLGAVADGGEKASKGLKTAAGGAAAMGAAFGGLEIAKDVVSEFEKTQDATARLSQAMQQAGEKDTPKFRDELEKAQTAGEKLGFSAGDTTDALAKLRLAGVDTAKGMAALPELYDLARAKGIDLGTATDAVVQGMQGQGKALKAMNVELPQHLATTVKLTAAQDALAKAQQASDKADQVAAQNLEKAKLAYAAYTDAVNKHGEGSKQAAAAEKTYQAAVQANGNALTVSRDAHKKLADAQANLAKATKDVGDRTHQLDDVLNIVHGKTAGQATAATKTLSGQLNVMKTEFEGAGEKIIGGALPALSKVTEALGFLGEHMNVVLPIMGVLIGLFVLWKTAMLIADIIEGVSTAVGGLNAALAFLAANPIVLVIAAVALLIAGLVFLEVKFGFIQKAAAAVFNWLKEHWPLLLDIVLGPFGLAIGQIIEHWGQITGFFGTVIGGIKDVFGKVFDYVTAPFRAGFDAIADLWNNTVGKISFKIPGWVPGIGGDGFSMPQMPRLHTGGLVPGLPGQEVPVLLMAGERVTNADRVRRGSGGGHTINIVQNTHSDPVRTGREVAWALKTAAV